MVKQCLRTIYFRVIYLDCWKDHICTLDSGEWSLPFGLLVLAGNEDMHKISDEFEFRPDQTTDYGVSCPWGLKHFLIMGKWCLHACSFIFDRIIIKVAGNQDRHKSLVEFDFGHLVSMAHLYVFLNEIWPWHIGLRWAIIALWATCWKVFYRWEIWDGLPVFRK